VTDLSNGTGYLECDGGGIFVLPESHDPPARLFQDSIVPPIARNVAVELVAPPFGITPWSGCVLRATVPVAPIHHHGNPLPRECDVGFGAQRRNGTKVDSEP
jgi:hypothetical protein